MALALQAFVFLLAAWYAVRFSARDAAVAVAVTLAAQTTLAYVCRPFNNRFAARLNGAVALPVAALGVAAAFAMPLETAVVILAAAALLLRLATALLYHWPGGVTELSIPLVGLIVEAFTLSYIQKGISPIG